MRKVILLFTLIAFSAILMSQTVVLQNANITKGKIDKTFVEKQKATKAVVWTCTFDEATPLYELETTPGQSGQPAMRNWEIVTEATYPDLLKPDAEGRSYFHNLGQFTNDSAPANGKWIMLNIMHGIQENNGRLVFTLTNYCVGGSSSIVFKNINLTGVEHPSLKWEQMLRLLNPTSFHRVYIDLSTDNGATWTEKRMFADAEHGVYVTPRSQELGIPQLANCATAAIRFRWVNTTDSPLSGGTVYPFGFGWQLNNVSIENADQYKLKMTTAVANFFEYADYTAQGDGGYFHYSSHIGQINNKQFRIQDSLGFIVFNIAVHNQGYEAVTPKATVKVFNEANDELFTSTVTGPSLAAEGIDTLDLLETFYPAPTIPFGTYKIKYFVEIPGQTEENMADNVDSAYFKVVKDFIGRDFSNPTKDKSPKGWSNGGSDGERIGTDFKLNFPDKLTSIEVFFREGTTPGAQVDVALQRLNYAAGQSASESELWPEVYSTGPVELEAADVNNWKVFTMGSGTDGIDLEVDASKGFQHYLIAIKMLYGGADNQIYIGSDVSGAKSSSWGTRYCFLTGTNAGKWFSISNDNGGSLCLHMNFNGYTMPGTSSAINLTNDINIYPNPSNDIINIANVEGSDISIYNIMGQVVESINNAKYTNSIDMSKYANGTYIVKVVKGSSISTHKFNLMK